MGIGRPKRIMLLASPISISIQHMRDDAEDVYHIPLFPKCSCFSNILGNIVQKELLSTLTLTSRSKMLALLLRRVPINFFLSVRYVEVCCWIVNGMKVLR